MPLAPLIIRFGEDAPLEALAVRMRCSRCGRKGITVNVPSWLGGDLRIVYERCRWTGEQDWHPALGAFGVDDMCNLYSHTRSRAAVMALFKVSDNPCVDVRPQPAIFPRSVAPVV